MNSDVSFEIFLGTYNASPWIFKTLSALENQTHDPFKVTIIDNASEDNTVEIIQDTFQNNSLKNHYRLIRNKQNIGPISTFMDRLELFESEWIFMIHQDDFYHENHIYELTKGIKQSSAEVGLVFTAMKRMNHDEQEITSTPTIASKISEKNRLENFQLALQINPVNFPSCALRKSVLTHLNTTRHTSAFNDTELILKLMCISDVKYLPIETMHYRIHRGNAHSITNSESNDFAVLIGLNELFHSDELKQLLENYQNEIDFEMFIKIVNLALEIRISDNKLRNISKGIIAETLIRYFGYQNNSIASLSVDAHSALGLEREQKIISNLNQGTDFDVLPLFDLSNRTNKTIIDTNQVSSALNPLVKLFNLLPLKLREKFLNEIFTSPIGKFLKRPFAKTWYLRGKRD